MWSGNGNVLPKDAFYSLHLELSVNGVNSVFEKFKANLFSAQSTKAFNLPFLTRFMWLLSSYRDDEHPVHWAKRYLCCSSWTSEKPQMICCIQSQASSFKLQVPLLSLFTQFEQSSTRRYHANNSGWHVTLSSYPRSATTSGAVSASFSVFQNSLCSFSCLNFDLPLCVDYLGNAVGRTWASARLSGDLYPPKLGSSYENVGSPTRIDGEKVLNPSQLEYYLLMAH